MKTMPAKLKRSPVKTAKSQSRAKARTDPALITQLKAASDNADLVEAVVKLKPDVPSQIVPSADRTVEITDDLLGRAEQQSGKKASRYNVFRNLGSFVVSAAPTFIEHLAEQPEVDSVIANNQPESALIAPIRSKPKRAVTSKSRAMAAKQTARRSAK